LLPYEEIKKSFVNKITALTLPTSNRQKIVRFEFSVEKLDILDWLKSVASHEKLYWSDRDQVREIGTIGKLLEFKLIESNDYSAVFHPIQDLLENSSYDLRFFGGIRFSPEKQADPAWNSFGTAYFFLPRFEMLRIEESFTFIYNFLVSDSSSKKRCLNNLEYDFQNLKNYEINSEKSFYRAVKVKDIPSKENWQRLFKKAIEYIDSGEIQKIVLARKSQFQFRNKIDPLVLFEKVNAGSQNTFSFYFQPQEKVAFFGATPEMLFYRQNSEIYSEAIAGTRIRGKNLEQDQAFANELLSNEKELLEHRLVSLAVKKNLKTICHPVEELIQEKIMKLTYVQHLQTKYIGQLKENNSDLDIILALHPTPAVAGYPKNLSLNYIAELETFDRGWYAGPIGWFGREEAEFAVAIRSALVNKNFLNLYVGAGIVTGSVSEKEWEEFESKVLNYKRILN
jgi:menaquinone-specific isochorismate synthase